MDEAIQAEIECCRTCQNRMPGSNACVRTKQFVSVFSRREWADHLRRCGGRIEARPLGNAVDGCKHYTPHTAILPIRAENWEGETDG